MDVALRFNASSDKVKIPQLNDFLFPFRDFVFSKKPETWASCAAWPDLMFEPMEEFLNIAIGEKIKMSELDRPAQSLLVPAPQAAVADD